MTERFVNLNKDFKKSCFNLWTAFINGILSNTGLHTFIVFLFCVQISKHCIRKSSNLYNLRLFFVCNTRGWGKYYTLSFNRCISTYMAYELAENEEFTFCTVQTSFPQILHCNHLFKSLALSVYFSHSFLLFWKQKITLSLHAVSRSYYLFSSVSR